MSILEVIKSKAFILNMLVLAAFVIQYLIDNKLFPNWIVWEGLALAIINMVAVMIQGIKLQAERKLTASLKRRVSTLESK
jgi:hypothetical protein